jgi:hypothetical protein
MDIPLLLALWLHTLAFVIAWGYCCSSTWP